MRLRSLIIGILLLLLLTAGLAGCSASDESVVVTNSLAPLSSLPDEIRAAPTNVQEAYRFAIANPDILHQIPCYCGCGAVGHKNNYQCYISSVGADGKPVFDNHALG